MVAMEGTVGTLVDQLNDYSGEITRLMKLIEDNDTGTKQAIQTEITGIQSQIAVVEQTYQTVKSAGTALDGRVVGIDTRVTMTEMVSAKANTDLGTLNNGIILKMAEIDTFMQNNEGGKGKGNEESKKPIMEYKMIGDLDKLTNDKSGFRDWKDKVKDAFGNIYKDEDFMKILEYVEDVSTKWTGSENLEETFDDVELQGITVDKVKWEKWGRDLKSLILQKSEQKSEAFLLVKRAGCGWSAWYSINKWYSATSGENLSARMSKLMNPKQSKRDEDVMHDVEKWMDELRECSALGASEMGYDYRLTAIRGIATSFIQGQMDIADTGMDQTDKKARFQRGYDTLMSWARRKMIEGGNKAPKPDVNMGQMGNAEQNSGYGKGQYQPGPYANPGMMAMGKGYNKGGYGGNKGYQKGFKGGGKQQSWNPGKGKGYGKGNDGGKGKGKMQGPPKGPTGKTIFYGNCHGCGKKGHTKGGCPQQGKGFKGNCNSCGDQGHTWDQCPQYPYGKGKGKGGMNSVESENDQMHLGGGDENNEPEVEKDNEESTENSKFAGMNQFGPISSGGDWNEDYNNTPYGYDNSGYGDYGPPGLYWQNGFYTLKRIEESKHEKCDENCECGFQKKETKCEKKNRLREEAFKKGKTPEGIMSVGKADEGDWIEIEAIVDSGAVDTIAPQAAVVGLELKQTELSKRNAKYSSADGGVIQNLGECVMEGFGEDGTPMKLTTQVGDKVTNMLIAVRRMVESGNMVIFGANHQAIRKLAASAKIEKNMIVAKNGRRTEIKDEKGMYVYKMRIKSNFGPKGKNDMDIGAVNKGKNDYEVDYSIDDPF